MAKQPPSYSDPSVISSLEDSASSTGNDYKCIVTLFFYGGMDTNNVLVPTGTNPNLSTYESLRAPGVRMEQNEILPLGDDAIWGIHENLPTLKDIWDEGNIAFIHDVGPLTETTTKTQYMNERDEFAPIGIFSHNTQQLLWQSAVKHRDNLDSGWAGRLGNLINPTGSDPIFNVNEKIDSSILTLSGSDLQSTPFETLDSVVIPPKILLWLNKKSGYVDQQELNAIGDNMRHDGLNPPELGTNNLVNSFVAIYNDSIDLQKEASDNFSGWDGDPDLNQTEKDELNKIFSDRVALAPIRYFVDTAKRIAQVIYSSKSHAFDQRRQTIFTGYGGWDNHSGLRSGEDPLLTSLNYLIESLVLFLKHPSVNLYDSVAICHESDFNRTLRSNNNAGTDHAWAGHSFVIGGSVNGGFYPTGYMPEYDPDGNKSVDNLGRFIPEVAVDQMYAKLLHWFGVPEQHLDLVLPGLPTFTNGANLDFKFATGNYTLNFI